MNFEYSEKEKLFRIEIKDWLENTLPKSISDKVRKHQRLSKQDYQTFMTILNDKGWLATHWPTEYGGTGWNAIEKHIFEEEIIIASAPRIVPFGTIMLGPVLIEFGSEEQKKYYLPRILNGEDVTPAMIRKATEHAKQRMKQGKSPFKNIEDDE